MHVPQLSTLALSIVVLGFAASCAGEDEGAEEALILGLPCDVSDVAAAEGRSSRVVSSSPACGGEAACVFAVEQGEAPCMGDADCLAFGLDDFECQQGACVPSDDYLSERSMCATSCEVDADCESAEDTACVSGFTCSHVATTGPDCCTRHCICADDLNVSDAMQLARSCAEGTEPGCTG